MKTLLVHPLFLIGIAIRLAIVAGAISQPVVDWYAPFLSTSVSQWNMDPWGVWLAHGGSPAAFPYGYVMWLLFLPLTLLGKLVGMAPEHAYALTLGWLTSPCWQCCGVCSPAATACSSWFTGFLRSRWSPPTGLGTTIWCPSPC